MWKKGDKFKWFDLTYQIIKIRKDNFDIAQPVADAFGKILLIGHKTFHKRDMIHAQRIDQTN